MINTDGEKQNRVQQAGMSSVINECDVDYGLSVDMSGAYYENATTTVPMTSSRGISVFRRLRLTKRTVQVLRKRGVLSKRAVFLWKVGKWVGNLHRDRLAVSVLALMGLGILLMIFTSLSVGLAVFFIVSLLALFLDSIKWHVRKRLAKFEQHISGKYSQSRRVEFPISLMKNTDGVNVFVNSRGNETVLNMDEKKQLFELLGKYPVEVDEQIAKLMRTKAELPKNNREAEMVWNEINAALEKLFAARNTEENTRVLEEVRGLFANAVRRKDVEELIPAVAELSDVSEFLNDLGKNREAEVSEAVEALNKVAMTADTDEELFVKQHFDEDSRKQHYL